MIKKFTLKIYIYLRKKFFGFKKINSLHDAKNLNKNNYENTELLNIIYLKNKKFRKEKNSIKLHLEDKEIFSNIFRKKNNLKVLDLGGGGGHLYYVFKKNFKFKNFIWFNLETKGLVKFFRKKFKRENNLYFIKNLRDIPKKLDLFYCNSSFQYLENQSFILKFIVRTKFDFIYISRTFLNHKNLKTIHALQESILSENGPGKIDSAFYNDKIIKYPIFIFSQEKFLKILSKNYLIRYKNIDKNDFIIVDGEKYFSNKILLQRKKLF